MPLPELVIFDCDGVLVDSEIIAARTEAVTLQAAGVPIEAEEIMERYSGMTFKNILLEVEREHGVPLSASLIEKNERLVDEKLKRELRAIPGAAEAALKVTTKRCICSNSSPERLEMMLGLTGLTPIFGDRVYSSKGIEGVREKPAPDIFLHALKVMDVSAGNAIVIEDSTHGVHGAVAAGIRVIGFTGGSHSTPGHADRLTEAGAETVISRMSDLYPVLKAMAEWRESA